MILNVEEVETPDNTLPLLIPLTLEVTALNVSVLPSPLISVILLKCGSFPAPLLNAIIVSVFIPTPAKLRLFTLALLLIRIILFQLLFIIYYKIKKKKRKFNYYIITVLISSSKIKIFTCNY